MNRLSSIVKDCLRGGVLLGAGVSSLVSGCSNYGNMVARDLARTGLTQVIISGVRNEIEGPRGTVVNVGGTAYIEPPVDDKSVLVRNYVSQTIFYYRITDLGSGRYEDYEIGFDKWAEELINRDPKHRNKFPNGYLIETVRNGKIVPLMEWDPEWNPEIR